MNIDERLEAMARTLDTLIKIHLDNDREYRERFAEIAGAQRENEARFAQVTRNFEVMLDSLNRLAEIARAHEQRLDDLEDHP